MEDGIKAFAADLHYVCDLFQAASKNKKSDFARTLLVRHCHNRHNDTFLRKSKQHARCGGFGNRPSHSRHMGSFPRCKALPLSTSGIKGRLGLLEPDLLRTWLNPKT